MTVKYFCIGAQKCGTTFVHKLLNKYKFADSGFVKEINYFNNHSKVNNLSDYLSNWKNIKGKNAEINPSYYLDCKSINTIKQFNENARFLLIIRDPIKRAYSQYWDNRSRLIEPYEFDYLVKNNIYMDETYNPKYKGYFTRGLFDKYIPHIKELLGNNYYIQITNLDIMKNDSQLFYQSLLDWLEIYDYNDSIELIAANKFSIPKNIFFKYFFQNPHLTKLLPKILKKLITMGPKKQITYNTMNSYSYEKLKVYYKNTYTYLTDNNYGNITNSL